MPPLAADEARRRLTAARIGYLGTVREDGRPHVVPIVFAVAGDEIYAIADPKPKRGLDLLRHRNIQVNPAVSLLVDEYEESWERIWWVRADGVARIVDAGSEREKAIDLLRAKYTQYGTWTTPFGDAMVMRIARVTSWTIRV